MIAQQEEGRNTGPAGLPAGIDRQRHIELTQHSPWPRRLVVIFLAVFCIAALANVFGQVATVKHADAGEASLTVDSPERLRGGVIFTSVITVVAHQQVQDAKLVLTPGWFNGVTLNAASPQSNQESSNSQGAVWDYGQVDAGVTMPLWISWQVNPTTFGPRDQDVLLYDGDTLVTSVNRTVTVFP